jgi:hypothetical protein
MNGFDIIGARGVQIGKSVGATTRKHNPKDQKPRKLSFSSGL